MKKKKLKIREVCPINKDDLDLPSKIIMKEKGNGLNFCRKLKLKNNGGLWVNPNETRMSIKIYDSNNTLGKPEVSIKLRDGRQVEMSFLDLAYLKEILDHTQDLGLNLFNTTVVEKKEKI